MGTPPNVSHVSVIGLGPMGSALAQVLLKQDAREAGTGAGKRGVGYGRLARRLVVFGVSGAAEHPRCRPRPLR
jgi:hypothetical protein